MLVMFIICGALATIVAVIHALSVAIARWSIRNFFDDAIKSYLLDETSCDKIYDSLNELNDEIEVASAMAADSQKIWDCVKGKNGLSISFLIKRLLITSFILSETLKNK